MKSKASLFHSLAERAQAKTAPKARGAKRRELQMETLEERVLLSVSPAQPVAQPLPAHNVHAAAHALSHAPAAAFPDATAAPQTAQAAPPAHPSSVQTVSWIGGDGFWDVASNWSTGTVPTSNDDVIIDPAGGPFTIIIRAASTAKTLQCAENLQINAGGLTLTGAGLSTISGDLIIGSNLSSTGPLTLSGTTSWIGGGGIFGPGTMTNTGTFTKSPGNLPLAANLTNAAGGTLNFGDGTTTINGGVSITNSSGGTLNLSGNFNNGGTGTIVNAGTLNVTGGTPAIGAVLNNTGTIHVSAGTLTLRNGGTSYGIMNVDSGATLQWLDGTGTGTFLLDTGAQTNGGGTYLVTNFGDVGVAAGHTVTFQNLQIEAFSQIGGDGNVIIPSGGVVTWNGGSFYGTGKTTIQAGGVANAAVGGAVVSLETHVMDLYGTLNLNSAGLNLHNASTLNVMPVGVVNLYGTGSITGPSGSVLSIGGTVNVDVPPPGFLAGRQGNAVGAPLAAISGPTVGLNGTLHIKSGTLTISSPFISTGSFLADAGTNVNFIGFVNYEMAPGTHWDGPGHYYIDTFTTVTLDAGLTLAVQNLQIKGTVAGPGNLTIAAGGALTFPSGAILQGTGLTTISTGATATGSNLTLTDGRTLVNDGTFNAQFITTGGSVNSTINNNADGSLNIAPPAGQTFASISARLLFNNFGTVNFTGGLAGGSFDAKLSNDGTINVLGGEVTIQELNVAGGSTSTGTFNAAPGATLSFFSGYTFNTGTQWTGAGTFKFVSGIYNFPTGVTFSPQHAALNNATFTGAGAIAVPAGASWTGGFGTLQNLGAFTVGSSAILALAGVMTFDNVPVTNNGLITVTGNNAQFTLKNGTNFNNAASGELRFVGLTTGGGFQNSSNATFTNNGLLRNASSAGNFQIFGVAFSNPGTLETDGGNFTVFGTLPQISVDKTVLLAGTWLVLGGTLKINDIVTQDFFGNPLVTVVENDASVTLSGAGTHFNALNNLATNVGDLAVLDGATLDINAYVVDPGPVDPQGPIPGPLTNSGNLEIGAGAAVIVGTDYTQTAAGTLTMHLADTVSNNGGGTLHVAGTANLDGTLAVALDNGFVPVAGDDYSIATFATRVGDFASFNGVQPLFDIRTTATGYMLHTTGVQADLIPTVATVNTTGAVGDNITVNYTVLNQAGLGTAASSWTDSIFLSPTAIFDAATAILLGRVTHTGALDANTSYNDSLTTAMPAVTPGTYYVVVIADSRGQVADSNRANNRFAATMTVNATIPTLTLGTPLNSSIADGQTRLYKITLPAGVTRIALNTAAVGAAELLVRNDAGEQFAFDATSSAQSLLINVTTPGDYFIELHATALAGAGTNFSLLASALAFSLDAGSPAAATNNGSVTITLRGAQFTPNTTVKLHIAGMVTELTPTSIVYSDPSKIFATFDLTGVATGDYDITINDGAKTATLASSFTVLPAPVLSVPLGVSLVLIAPPTARAGYPSTLLVTVTNPTSHDLPAPLLQLSSDNGTFQLPGDGEYIQDFVEFFATNPDGIPNVLPPGFHHSYVVSFLPIDGSVGGQASVALDTLDPTAPINLTKLEDEARPPGAYTDDQWTPIQAQLLQQVGPTYGNYESVLRADVPLLPDELGDASNPIDVLQIEVTKAIAALNTSITGAATTTDPSVSLSGRLVTATNTDTGDSFNTISLRDGSFIFPTVTAGHYLFQFEGAANTNTTPFSVADHQHASGVTLPLVAGETLRGTILALDGGAPVADATVSAIASDGSVFTVSSDAAGHYAVSGLVAGDYSIVVDADGKARAFTDNVTIGAGGLTSDFALASEATITGAVAFSGSGTLDNTTVFAQVPGNNSSNGIFTGVLADDGTFTIPGLPAGTYDVVAMNQGYLTTMASGITVAAGGTASAGTLSLGAAASISGTITSTDPALAANLLVGAYNGSDLVSVAQADVNGSFTLTDLPAGNYDIRSLDTTSFATSANVTVTEGQAFTGVALTIQPGGTISGTLMDSTTSLPLANLPVFATAPDGTTLQVLADANGHYSFDHLDIGSYRVSAGLNGAGAAQVVNVPVLTGPAVTANLSATISARIAGTLRLADNTPVGSANVELLENGVVVASGASMADGTFLFALQRSGTFEIRASAANATFAPVTGIVVTVGGNVQQNLTAGSGTLNVTVTDNSGPVVDSQVLLVQADSNLVVRSEVGGADGVVSFGNLAAGNYRVQVTGDNGRGAFTTINVPGTGTTPLALPQSATASVSGTVSITGAVAADATLTAYLVSDRNVTFSAPIAADGSYSLAGLPGGNYDLVATSGGSLTSVATNVSVANSTLYNVTLNPSNGTLLGGRIVDPDGNPIANAIVTVVDAQKRVLGQARTGIDGKFAINSAIGNPLTLRVSVPDADPFAVFDEFGGGELMPDQSKDVGDLQYANFVQTTRFDASALKNLGLFQVVAQGALFDRINQKINNLTFAPDHVFDKFDNNPLCVKCNTERQAAIKARDKQNDYFKNEVLRQQKILFYSRSIADSAIIRETAKNVQFLLELVGIGASAYVLATGVEAGLAAEVTQTIVDIATAVIDTLNKNQEALNPSNEPQDAADKLTSAINDNAKTAGKAATAINTISLIKYRIGSVGAAKFKLVTDVVDKLSDYKNTVATLNYTDSLKDIKDLIKQEKEFDKVYKTYKDKYVRAAAKAKDAFYNCLRRASSNSNCNPIKPRKNPPGPRKNPPGPGGGIFGPIIRFLQSLDPNDIIGPAGSGDAHFVGAQTPLPYTIEFENQASASANAAEVVVTQQLDSDLDLSTFQLTGYGFGGHQFSVPGGHSSFSTRLDLTATSGIFLDVSANLNLTTGLLTWTFRSIDPATGDVPSNPNLGFLPPDIDGIVGTGYVSYVVQPKATVPTGTVIDAQASVVFDANAPILTAAIFNTIDAVAPTAHVTALPAQSGPDFTVQWGGADDNGGSGIASYDVYVSEDHGAFAPLLLNTTRTAAVFTGEVGHSYQFIATARDFAGNLQSASNNTLPDTSVNIVPATDLTVDAQHPLNFLDANGDKVTVKVTGPGSGKVELVFGAASNADLRSLVLTGTNKQTSVKISVAPGGSTTIGRIDGALKSLTLGSGVTLGDGLDDHATDLTLHGSLTSLKLSSVANFAEISLGEGLTDASAAKFQPTFTAGDLGNNVSLSSVGGFGAITVHSWGASGTLDARQSVAALNIATGNWFVATVDLDSSHLAPGTAKLGPVLLNGALQASSVAVEGGISKITTGGLLGSTIHAGGAIGNVTINLKKQASDVSAVDGSIVSGASVGNVVANVAGLAGLHFARGINNSIIEATTGSIGNISANVSGPDLADGHAIDFTVFTAPQGSIGNLSASAKSSAATTDLEAIRETDFFAGINVGNISALAIASNAAPAAGQTAAFASGDNRDVTFTAVAGKVGNITATAQGGADFNRVFATDQASRIRVNAGTSIGAIALTANKGASANSQTLIGDAADFFAGKNIGAVTLSGEATANLGSDLVFYAGGRIASVSVSATDPALGTLSNSFIFAGQSTAIAKNADLAKAALGALTLTGSLLNSTVVANGNLGALTVGGDATGNYFVAGVDVGNDTFFLTGDDTYNRAASIASLSVGGLFATDTIAAGVNPGSLFIFGDADDSSAPTIPGVTATSKIGPIKLGAATVPAAATTAFAGPVIIDHTDAIEAPQLTSIRIAGRPAFHDFSSPVWIDGNGDGNEDASEVVVRTVL